MRVDLHIRCAKIACAHIYACIYTKTANCVLGRVRKIQFSRYFVCLFSTSSADGVGTEIFIQRHETQNIFPGVHALL